MPQMMPITWMILLIMFSMIFLLFNMVNYYSILPSSPKSVVCKTTTYTLSTLHWNNFLVKNPIQSN